MNKTTIKTKVTIKQITRKPNDIFWDVLTNKGIFTSSLLNNKLDQNMTNVEALIWYEFNTYKTYIHAAVVLKDPRATIDLKKAKEEEKKWDNIYDT